MVEENLHQIKEKWRVDSEAIGTRIDQYLCSKFPEYSRAAIQQWIRDGLIKLNGNDTKCKTVLKGFEWIEADVQLQVKTADQPQSMPLDIRHQDEHLIVLNKPAGLTVHPGSGQPDGTLLNGLLALDDAQSQLHRAGIVHRLDKDTSGLMLVARTVQMQNRLIEMIKQRAVKRQYLAIVKGVTPPAGCIDRPIGRHPTQRVRMAVHPQGKHAVTHFTRRQHTRHFSLLQVQLETGRTHQIRVHMHALGHTLVGDPLYGNPQRVDAGVDEELKHIVRSFPRQALHAELLALTHPVTGKALEFRCDWPEDMQDLYEDMLFLDGDEADDGEMEVEYC